MATLQWDRLFETCIGRNRNALLVSGSPPLMPFGDCLRTLLVPPLNPEDIRSMIDEVKPAAKNVREIAGYRSFEIKYGREYIFRVQHASGKSS